jgi:hypothetical protein
MGRGESRHRGFLPFGRSGFDQRCAPLIGGLGFAPGQIGVEFTGKHKADFLLLANGIFFYSAPNRLAISSGEGGGLFFR